MKALQVIGFLMVMGASCCVESDSMAVIIGALAIALAGAATMYIAGRLEERQRRARRRRRRAERI